jgi:hypothetical protein
MNFANMLAITSNPYLSMAIWIALVLAALYFARRPFHRAIQAVVGQFYQLMRLTASGLSTLEQRVIQRNRQLMISAGIEKAERTAERELFRISAAVNRDLHIYPGLHRQLSEIVNKLEQDYVQSAEVPPSLPNWIPVIESIAQIDTSKSAMVASMLAEIRRTLSQQHQKALESFRNSSASRHANLNKMRPQWRKVTRILGSLEKSIARLNQRSRSIDRYMETYETLCKKTNPAVEALSVSILSQIALNGLLLSVAAAGAYFYHQMLSLPLSRVFEAVGPGGPAGFAATIVVSIALSMGLFLMESLRITRLFPAIGSLDDRTRLKLMWAFLSVLLLVAAFGALLAWLPAPAVIATTSSPAGLLLEVGRMGITFILPFLLSFFAIPFEGFVSPFRVLTGWGAAAMLRATVLGLRLLGRLGISIGRLVISAYDLTIFPALWLEHLFLGLKTGSVPLKDKKRDRASTPADSG